jgi:hypothetical protein
MDKDEKRFVIEGAVKALIALIPGIGGTIGSILSDALADRKEQRIKEFLSALKTEIEANKMIINTEFINKNDFLDVFEITTRKIANERSEEKRSYFKNILLHGMLSANDTYDEVEYQMRILEQLNNNHLFLLRFFRSPKQYGLENGISQVRENILLRLFRQIFPAWDIDHLFDHLKDLENSRLIEDVTGNFRTMTSGLTIDNLEGKLTSKGATFISFIVR